MTDARGADRRRLAREDAPSDIEPVRTEGSRVVADDGRVYVDFTMGWCVGNFGWGDEEIRRRLARYRGPDYVHPEHRYRGWARLAEELVRVAPGKLRRVFRATGGTEAVDLAMQAAALHTGRTRFLALEGSYHGNSLATIALASGGAAAGLPGMLRGSRCIAPPLGARAAARVEKLVATRRFAALVMEPVSMSLGVLVPTQEFMDRAARACRRTGTLLVMDEVACGFGRTGRLFASDHFGIEPDILCLAKAITGGYAPLGATLMTEAVAKSMTDEGSFWSTYGWHPRSVEAALAVMRHVRTHRRRLQARTAAMSRRFARRLARMRFPKGTEIRVQGLAIAIELPRRRKAEPIVDACRRKGLLLANTDERTLVLFPALDVDAKTADAGLDTLERCL